jgi:hypothetical protein
MKKYLACTFIAFWAISANSQTCEEIMKYVKSASYGTIYTSYNSEAISKVTFYEIIVGFETKYFAIVCFKRKYTYECKEYIYQVGSSTKFNYSLNYISSAGKAFWEYIHPYRKTLGCAPDFEE